MRPCHNILHRILILWFVVSILGLGVQYGSVLFDPGTPNGAHSQLDGTGGDLSADSDAADDHCAHGALHLLAMPSEAATRSFADSPCAFALSSPQPFTSRPAASLFRPPILG